jgi:Type I phosphodiesterase / nucleotide pyrophosphatase
VLASIPVIIVYKRRMSLKKSIAAILLSLVLLGGTVPARAGDDELRGHTIKHVLLISVDGLHSLDVANYVAAHPGSALAELSNHGVTFTNARTPALSDSFPGLLALVTGGSPISHGLFYDVSYNRSIYDPTNPTCSGGAGNMQVFDESIDKYSGTPPVSENVIDPKALPNHINAEGKCVRFFPHDAMESNTIFEAVRAAGGHTAWADKHPAYDIANGPSGKGVEDLYTPELTNFGGFDNTVSVVCTAQNDQLKVNAILNEIKGLRHDGAPGPGVPTVFGMNFQEVSVGQKLEKDNNAKPPCAGDEFTGQPGGYKDGAGAPTTVLAFGLKEADQALASFIKALKTQGIYDSTLIIVTAKHGQSPINPVLTNKPGHFADLVAALPDASTDPGAIAIANANNCSTGPCGFVQDDDIALIWLSPADQAAGKGEAVRSYLNKNAQALFIEQVMAGAEINARFNNPLHDSRTPDVIVQPVYGTIYTASTAKNAEHGGFSIGDTNVGLIVSNPSLNGRIVKTLVLTSQVAPTILDALGISPLQLDAVRKEGTPVLPFIFSDYDSDDK